MLYYSLKNYNLMKKFNVLMIALAAFALGACSLIEDAATVKVDISDFTIDIPANVEGISRAGGLTRADGLNPFSGSYTLSISESQFGDLNKYKNVITDVKIDAVTVTITQSGLTDGIAQNVKLEATGVNDFIIASYTFGQAYTNPGLITFVKNTILQLKNDSVTIHISGVTNANSGPLTVTISVEGVQLWAKTITF